MADVIAGEGCPLCGSRGRPAGERDGYSLRACECRPGGGVLLSWQWRTERAYERLYSEGLRYPVDEQIAGGQRPMLERRFEYADAAAIRIAQVMAITGRGRRDNLLDVGCGTGEVLQEAWRQGFLASGVEPNRTLVKTLQGSSWWRVLAGTWRDVPPANSLRGWHVITLYDVLEHVTRPVECLRHLKGCLRPGGAIVVEWPEWGCEQAKRDGLNWRHVRPRQHVCLYSDEAARELFRLAGLGVLAAERPLAGSLGKVQYYLCAS